MHSENTTKALNIPKPGNRKPLFPYARASSVEGYFNLPKKEREKWGIYLKPYSLPCDIFNKNEKGWKEFDRQIRKHYPIQGWVREWFLSYDNPVYAFFFHTKKDIYDIKCNIKNFFKPGHPRFRKVYPRHIWQDISNVMVEINFALIQDFWHEEVYPDSYVDWHSDPKTEEVYNWLQSAIDWIEKARPELEKRCREELHKAHQTENKSYDETYGEHNRLEKLLYNTDTEILNKFVEYRDYLWT